MPAVKMLVNGKLKKRLKRSLVGPLKNHFKRRLEVFINDQFVDERGNHLKNSRGVKRGNALHHLFNDYLYQRAGRDTWWLAWSISREIAAILRERPR